jgi:hypothetical protein
MTASKLNPNTYQGTERSSGYIARNEQPKSASSPDWRGRIYLIGIGWYWISGWVKDGRGGPMLSLRAEEMTDEQAEKFCAPKGGAKKAAKPTARRQLFDEEQAQAPGNSEPDIPF